MSSLEPSSLPLTVSLGSSGDGKSLPLLTLADEQIGSIEPTASKILRVLTQDLDLEIFLHYVNALGPIGSLDGLPSSRTARASKDSELSLFVVLYGDPAFFENVGIFAAKCGIHLQHPTRCARNVPYQNPHCLPNRHNSIVYTEDLASLYRDVIMCVREDEPSLIDLFSDEEQQRSIAETTASSNLSTDLYPHQRQALTFMIEREKGWAFDQERTDIWTHECDLAGQPMYVNRVTGQKQRRTPPEFRGGLLTDAPGLGKTLSVIALIAFNKWEQAQSNDRPPSGSVTLLVVPKSCKLIASIHLFHPAALTNLDDRDTDLEGRVCTVSRPTHRTGLC